MTLFGCRHRWTETRRQYSGVPYPVEASGRALDVLRAQHGFTTIELKCGNCGKLEHDMVTGDQT